MKELRVEHIPKLSAWASPTLECMFLLKRRLQNCCIGQVPPPVNEAHQGPSRPWLTGPNHRGYPLSKGSYIPLEYNDSTVPEPEPVSPGRIEARSPPIRTGFL
eukprot:scaffold347_cov420-Pavlova_lutheri.AAC.5